MAVSYKRGTPLPQYNVQSGTPKITFETMYTSVYIVQRCISNLGPKTRNPKPDAPQTRIFSLALCRARRDQLKDFKGVLLHMAQAKAGIWP